MRWKKDAVWEVVLYYTRCPLCYRYFVAFGRRQLVMNVMNHMKKHAERGVNAEEVMDIKIYERRVILSAPPKPFEVEIEVGQP